MNRSILHTQLRHRLDDLVEKHAEFAKRQDSIPSAEMNQFLAEIKLVYELALSLHHHNSIQSMEDLEMAIASRFEGKDVTEETVTTADVANESRTMDELMIDAINRKEEEKNRLVAGQLKISGEVHDLFKPSPTIADSFKESATLADTVVTTGSTARISETLKHTRINDLLTAIGINERFYYIQHLFGGNAGVYHLTLERLNKESHRQQAIDYINKEIASKYNWDMSSQAVKNFLELVERKFLP